MIQDFARFLIKEIDAEIANFEGDLGRGQPQSWEDYKHLTGLIRGLRLVRDRVSDLAKKAETDDE